MEDPKSEAVNSIKQSTPSTLQSNPSRQSMGKLVFGSSSIHASREAQKVQNLFLPDWSLFLLSDKDENNTNLDSIQMMLHQPYGWY